MKRLVPLLLILIIALSPVSNIAQENTKEKKTYVILYDEGHSQYFTTDLMATALGSLNTSLDTKDLDVTITVIPINEKFNSTNLQGTDLLIVSNPGLDNETIIQVDETETKAIENLVEIGGSVLYMSNPLSNDPNVIGHGQTLNDLIFDRMEVQIAGISAAADDRDNTTVIFDELNFLENQTFVYIYDYNINDKTITQQVNNITEAENPRIVYWGGMVEEDNNFPGQISGNTSQFAYAVDADYTLKEYQDSPRWLYGKDFGENKGRGMVIGSTVMFSDYQFNSTVKWIELEQNLAFFQNIVAWLLHITPLPEELPIVTEPFEFFITMNLFYAIMFGGGLFLLIAGYSIYKGRISIKDLTKVRAEEVPKQKEKKEKQKEDQSSASSKKQKQRKRRKRL